MLAKKKEEMAFTTKRSDALSKKKGHKARPCMNLPTNKRKMQKDKKGEIMQSKKTFATRAIAWALAFVMVFTMIPYGAFAEGDPAEGVDQKVPFREKTYGVQVFPEGDGGPIRFNNVEVTKINGSEIYLKLVYWG